MKLKKLLLENKKSEDAEELAEILQSGDYYGVDPDHRLYRGVKGKSRQNTYDFYQIRKNRIPKNTSSYIDMMVEMIRSVEYPNRPNRKKSTFISGSKNIAGGYGTPHYVFVPKKANSWWSVNDAYVDFFLDSQRSIVSSQRVIRRIEQDDLDDIKETLSETPYIPLISILESIELNNHKTASEKIADNFEIVRNADEYADKLSKIKNKSDDVKNLQQAIQNLYAAVDRIVQYFESLEIYNGDVDSEQIYELIVEGDYILLANKQWFDMYVEELL